ncbi:hypothetical protein ABTY98_00025 [Streptomyces sp. NPDC096040]|uniref:hypothetical protein n=1 Tax=Streptomyces sp. NPDC096040 TaxID=3155541 RepID=UPI003316BD7D
MVGVDEGVLDAHPDQDGAAEDLAQLGQDLVIERQRGQLVHARGEDERRQTKKGAARVSWRGAAAVGEPAGGMRAAVSDGLRHGHCTGTANAARCGLEYSARRVFSVAAGLRP